MVVRLEILIVQFHFHGAEMLNLVLLHEYQWYRLNIPWPSQSIRYASQDVLSPKERTMQPLLLSLLSIKRSQVDHYSVHLLQCKHQRAVHQSTHAIIYNNQKTLWVNNIHHLLLDTHILLQLALPQIE